MITIGKVNELVVVKENKENYMLGDSESLNGRVTIPKNEKLNVGDKLNVFVYMNSLNKLVGELKTPLAEVGDIAYLEVVKNTKIGTFISIGLDKDILVPIKEREYPLMEGKKYLFLIYVDKTSRLAATTRVWKNLQEISPYNVGDEVHGIVYGYQTNNSLNIAVDNKYNGVILFNEYFDRIEIGEELTLKVKKVYDDGKLGLTPRMLSKDSRETLQDVILNYLKKNGGKMQYNDKSSPDDIRKVFKESKNNFKHALGGLMKKDLIYQNEEGTFLK